MYLNTVTPTTPCSEASHTHAPHRCHEKKVDPDLRGFSGGFLHDSKAYFVPSYNGRGAGAKFVRVDASNFSSSSVEVNTSPAVPQSGIKGLVARALSLWVPAGMVTLQLVLARAK